MDVSPDGIEYQLWAQQKGAHVPGPEIGFDREYGEAKGVDDVVVALSNGAIVNID